MVNINKYLVKFSLTNNVVGITIVVGVGGVVVSDGGRLTTTVDVSTGALVAANNDDAVGTVVPPSSTKDEDAYVGASVAFEGACVGTFVDSAGKSAAASALLPPRCHRRAVRRRRALRCRHRR